MGFFVLLDTSFFTQFTILFLNDLVILFAKEVGISHSIFEEDSELVINTLHSSDTSHPSFGHLIKDIYFWLVFFKTTISIIFIENVMRYCTCINYESNILFFRCWSRWIQLLLTCIILTVRAKNELSAQKQWWIQAHVARTMNL